MNQSVRVLVVDDDPDILNGIARLLEKAATPWTGQLAARKRRSLPRIAERNGRRSKSASFRRLWRRS